MPPPPPPLPTPSLPKVALPPTDPRELAGRLRKEVGRSALRARNGIRLATGSARADVGLTPKDVLWERGRVQLWHYRNDDVRYRPPLLLVFSLITKSYILDLQPGNSLVEQLRDAGFDVFLLDWGVADERDAGNTLEDYVDDFLPAGIGKVLDHTGAEELNVLGYCFGGVLSLLMLAGHPELPVRSLTTMATPVDYTKMGMFSELLRDDRLKVDDLLDDTGNVPGDAVRTGFRALKPTADLARYATLLDRMWDDQYLDAYSAMTSWSGDHVPFPGATARQTADMLVKRNGFVNDDLQLGGRPVHLSDITCPLLNVVAERDHIVPVDCATPLVELVGTPQPEELRLHAGHIGLAVGRTAAKVTVPKVIDFLRRNSDEIGDGSA